MVVFIVDMYSQLTATSCSETHILYAGHSISRQQEKIPEILSQ